MISIFLSYSLQADNLPHTFEAGKSIIASEVNENFNELLNRIKLLESSLSSNRNNKELLGFAEVDDYMSFDSKINACPQSYENSFACRIDDLRNVNLSSNTLYTNLDGDLNFTGHFWWDQNDGNTFCYTLGYNAPAGSIVINNGKIKNITTGANNNNCRPDKLLACCK